MDPRVGVFLVTGNRLLREALTRVLGKRPDISVLGAGPHGTDVVACLERSRAEVLLSDSVTADPLNLRAIHKLVRNHPKLKVVLIGMPDCEAEFLDAVRAGVAGYVLDDASAMDVVSAVRAVANGEAVCPPRLSMSLFRYVSRQAAEMPNVRVKLRLGLTRREQQLIPMIAEGLTNKEIAAALNLSEQTVKNHVHRMLRKAGAADRLSIVEMCRTQGAAF